MPGFFVYSAVSSIFVIRNCVRFYELIYRNIRFRIQFVFFGSTCGGSFRFRVYLKDKGDSGYTLDNPEEYLSKESVERRNRQGISVSESDLPIAQAYLDTLSANGGKPVLESNGSLRSWCQSG